MIASFVTVALVVAAAPAPLPPLPVPLGRLHDVLELENHTGAAASDEQAFVFEPVGCGHPVTINLSRLLGGTNHALGQLQDWLNLTTGLDRSLFGPTSRLTELVDRLSRAQYSAQKACAAPKPVGGYRLELMSAPKLCAASGASRATEHWFVSDGKPFAAVVVSSAAPKAHDACLPRLSLVLFDAQGAARLRYHADYAGAVSASLMGERCQQIDFTLDQKAQAFTAVKARCPR